MEQLGHVVLIAMFLGGPFVLVTITLWVVKGIKGLFRR